MSDDLLSPSIETLRQIVADAGGYYVGLQDALFPDVRPVLVFTNGREGALNCIRLHPGKQDENQLKIQVEKMLGRQK